MICGPYRLKITGDGDHKSNSKVTSTSLMKTYRKTLNPKHAEPKESKESQPD